MPVTVRVKLVPTMSAIDFNDGKENGHEQQTEFDCGRKVAKGRKQTLIDFRHAGLNADSSRSEPVAGIPVNHRYGCKES